MRIRLIQLLSVLSLLVGSAVAQDQDLIDLSKIPVFPQTYQHNIRAGYLNVSGYDQALYYIFCESQNKPADQPLILWLNGGPGCSSISGFLTQNGPFYFKQNDPSQMYINQYSWNKYANVLYLQSPGAVGFSTASSKYRSPNDSSVAKDNLKALQIFFDYYPQYKGNQFFIAGQSYAGVYIPRLAEEILMYNEAAQDARINLKGILIGNACTHPYECYTNRYYSRFTTEFLYTRGFLDETQYRQYTGICLTSQSSSNCINLQLQISNNFNNSKANIYNIYSKCYTTQYPPKNEQIMRVYQQRLEASQNNLKRLLRCTDVLGPLTLLNTNEYRAALKVNQLNDTLFWMPCSDVLTYSKQSKATYSTLPTLVKAGLKIFYFSGDNDAVVPIQGTLYWFNKYRLDYKMPIKRSWRPWVTKDQNVSGMLWQLDGMSLITVRGAGHMVPYDKPVEAQEILNVFLGRKQWQFPDYYLQMSQ